MTHQANPGGKGPKVTAQGKKGPIIGKMSSLTGSTQTWHPGKGTNKNLNTGKDVKKS